MPADDYDAKRKHFITSTGRVRTRAEVRVEIDRLTEYVRKEAKRYAELLDVGTITPAEFEAAMRQLLKSSHIVAASVGRGGRERMTPSDWGRVGNKLAWQYKYLKKFSRKIAADIISGPASSNRVQMYASALHVTYYQSVYQEMQDFPDKPKGKDGKELLVKRVLNAKESCDDCVAYANEGWMRLDEMPELGTLECGDFCKCDLIFSDDEQDEPA
jgi:hypothetical protein